MCSVFLECYESLGQTDLTCLQTERHRERMSTSLAASFPMNTVDSSLAELETKSKDSAVSWKDLSLGPFGVLNFNQPTEATEKSLEQDSSIPENVQPATPAVMEPLLQDMTPISLDSWMGLDDSLQWADLFGFGSDNVFSMPNGAFDLPMSFGDEPAAVSEPHLSMMEEEPRLPATALSNALSGAGSRLEPVDHSMQSIDMILNEAQSLLRNFKENVITRFSSLPITSKSPWEIISFTEAVNTLAHLSFLGTTTVTHAKKANLFAIVAMSAYYLTKNPLLDTQYDRSGPNGHNWEELIQNSTLEAKRSLQASLKHELHGPNKAKYKDQLMGILSLMALSVGVITKACSPAY